MTAGDTEDFDVVGAEKIRQHLRAGRRNELVSLCDDDQHRHGDVLESTRRPPSRAPPLHQRVVPDVLSDQLGEGRPGDWAVVPRPVIDCAMGVHVFVAPQVLPQCHVLHDSGRRLERAEHAADGALRHEARRLVDGVRGLQPSLAEVVDERRGMLEVTRWREQDDVGRRNVTAAAEQQQEHERPHAIGAQHDLVCLRDATHGVDGMDEVPTEVRVEGVVGLGGPGPAPVEEEDVETLVQQLLGPGDAGMKIEDGRVADETEEQHDRRPLTRPGLR